MTFTTSYKSQGLEPLLTALVRVVNPKKVIEFGTQQGHSASLIAKGTTGSVKTYDLFKDRYPEPPHKETHANLAEAIKNTELQKIKVYKKDVFKLKPVKCDLLHIDICNHYDNIAPLLFNWESYVSKMIILEGGVHNSWQKKYEFEPFNRVFEEGFMQDWDHIVIEGKDGYAMTVLTRK